LKQAHKIVSAKEPNISATQKGTAAKEPYLGLFFRDIGLFHGNICLFCGDVGLFWGDIGLFCRDMGL